MNGMRRFLGGGSQRGQPQPPTNGSPPAPEPPLPPLPPLQTTAPLVISKPSWPPTPITASQGLPATAKQDQSQNKLRDSSSSNTISYGAQQSYNKRSSDDTASSPSRPHSAHSSPSRKPVPMSPTSVASSTTMSGRAPNAIAGPSSPPRPLPNRVAQLSHKAVIALDPSWKRSSHMVDTRDELLMSLLASEAIVDSHDCAILTSDEVEELKKEYQVLDARIGAMNKKLNLEKKIRDAAVSLAKVNKSHKTVSKQSTEQLEAANIKVETVQKEVWHLSERSNEIMKKLLEHRAGVLSISVKNLEAKVTGHETDDSGYGTSSFRSAPMSPTSSETSHAMSSFTGKFEGPHLFAGHADAVQPMSPKKKKPTSALEVAALEEKLKGLTEKLKEASEAQQVAKRELSHVRLEKEEVETTMSMELQSAEDTIASLEERVKEGKRLEYRLEELERERKAWEAQKTESQSEIEALERRLEVTEEKNGEIFGMKSRLEEIEGAFERLREIMMAYGISHNPREGPSFLNHLESLEAHLENIPASAPVGAAANGDQAMLEREVGRQRDDMEAERRRWGDERQALVSEAESLQRERDEARRELKSLESRSRSTPSTSPTSSSITLNGDNNFANASPDLKKFMTILHPVWSALPSAETRASKFGVRKGSPTAAPGSPQTSLSELDVRLLKNLYDGRQAFHQLDHGGGSSPASSGFTAESFAQRVQSLIADDKALIERLIRFAQAHDLLKKNAERAQKLAQESGVALETYQKQVKVLEERNLNLTAHHAAMQDEVRELQDTIDRIMAEKREVETQAAAQAETCRQLTEANATLSAKALSLAEEAAAAPEAVRRQLEQQLAQCQASLEKAEEEVNAMRNSGQSQQMALLDELNSVQTDNENLRAQLRAAGKR